MLISLLNKFDMFSHLYILGKLCREQILIPVRKPCIILKGSGSNNTIITYNKSFHDGGQSMSATFHSSPPNVILSGIKFQVRKRNVRNTLFSTYFITLQLLIKCVQL
jgi:hypothetical protein